MALPTVTGDAATDADHIIARTIKAFMAYRKLSQEEVAAAIGLTQSRLSRRLSAADPNAADPVPFKASEVAAIARFLRVPVSQLYGGLDVTSPIYSLVEPAAYEQGELALEFADAPFTRPFPVAAA